jgi:Rrf2 family protein
MRISQKTIYAVQALIVLAEHAPNRTPIQLREIAEAYELPFKFLEQIAIPLKTAGWIRGRRSKDGGYALAIAPSQLKLGDILRRLEGSSALLDGRVDASVQDTLGAILNHCQASVDAILDNITLSDIVSDVRSRKTPVIDYVI